MNPFRNDPRWLALAAWWQDARGDIAAWLLIAGCAAFVAAYLFAFGYWLWLALRMILPR